MPTQLCVLNLTAEGSREIEASKHCMSVSELIRDGMNVRNHKCNTYYVFIPSHYSFQMRQPLVCHLHEAI